MKIILQSKVLKHYVQKSFFTSYVYNFLNIHISKVVKSSNEPSAYNFPSCLRQCPEDKY